MSRSYEALTKAYADEERRWVEEAVRSSERRFRALVQNATDLAGKHECRTSLCAELGLDPAAVPLVTADRRFAAAAQQQFGERVGLLGG